MKTFESSIFLLLLVTFCFAQPIPTDSLYLGKTPPENTPKIFISNAHARLAITNDGKTIYICQCIGDYNNTSYYKYFDNKWNGPVKLFSSTVAPTLSINEDTLFSMENKGAYRSFYSIQADSGWCEPKPISNNTLYYLQETNLGNYYFGDNNPKGGFGSWDICKMAINNGVRTGQNLGRPVNTDNSDVEFFIARDESYLVLGANEGGPGGRDLYISYRKKDNSWTNPKSLGNLINDGKYNKWGPFVTADNKYLFYAKATSRPYDIYWVRFDKLLDSLKHTNYSPYVRDTIENQNGKINHKFSYSIPDSIFYDDDGNNTLTYSASLSNGDSLPSWLKFNPKNKTIFGIPTSVDTITIKITATDSFGASISDIVSVFIKDKS